jgi:hypothetical protein
MKSNSEPDSIISTVIAVFAIIIIIALALLYYYYAVKVRSIAQIDIMTSLM